MRLERMFRFIAGAMVLSTAALGLWGRPSFLWLTLLVGAGLLQSGVTNWCPLTMLLRRAGVRD